MKVMGLGVDFAGRLLFPPVDEEQMADALVSALEANAARVKVITSRTAEGVSFRGEMERTVEDPGDPHTAGWTYLVNANDPQREEMERIVKPLAQHRGMEDPIAPLLYRGDIEDLLQDYYGLQLTADKVPQYILILGGPDQIPFSVQSLVDTVAKVGRVAFDDLRDLEIYVEKLIRLENAPEPVVSAEAIVFAPDHGLPDPTYFSREFLAKPLAEYVRDKIKILARTYLGWDATKENLKEACGGTPALVFTASHGLGAVGEPFEAQKRYNGAICCEHDGPLTMESLFSANDIPTDVPFLEGAIFFQFACFGYGTPAQSDFAHWLDGVPKDYAESAFIAALPTKLLAHPRGPIAYIGHLDTAFLHGFTDAEDPHILDRWHPRISPFVHGLNRMLRLQPCGFAMEDMHARYGLCNAKITRTYDLQRRNRLEWTPELKAGFLDNWILRGDSQNYMVLGDPAARLRIRA